MQDWSSKELFDELRRDLMAPEAPPDVPEQIDGYPVLERIGGGGQGQVYKVLNRRLDRTEALKILPPDRVPHGDERRRFEREVRVLAHLHHEGIVPVFDVGQVEGRPYFTMEFIAGESVAEILERENRLSPRAALRIARDAARALAAAHAVGVVHRDVKPANILVAPAQGPGRPEETVGLKGGPASLYRIYVTDFGLAREGTAASSLSADGTVFGTPAYSPPEQAAGDLRRTGPASDVYGLGATLYHMLCGRPPFEGRSAYEVIKRATSSYATPIERRAPGIARDVATIVGKCLERDPRRRYASASELADDMDRYLAGELIVARPAGPLRRMTRWARRRRGTVAAATLAVALAGVWLGVHLGRQTDLARGQAAFDRGALVEAIPHLERAGATELLERARARLDATDRARAWLERRGALGGLPSVDEIASGRELYDRLVGDAAAEQWMLAGLIAVAVGDDAEPALSEALRLNPASDLARLERARVRLTTALRTDRSRWFPRAAPCDAAGDLCDAAIADALSVGHHRLLARALCGKSWARRDFAAMRREAAGGLELAPESDALRFFAALAAFRLGEVPGSIPETPDGRILRALIGSEVDLDDLPDEPIVWLLRAQASPDEAESLLSRAPLDDPWVRFQRGLARQRRGAHVEAVEDFDVSDPSWPDLRLARSVSLRCLGLDERAADDLAAAVRGLPPSAQLSAELGELLLNLNRPAEALEALNASCALGPPVDEVLRLRDEARRACEEEP